MDIETARQKQCELEEKITDLCAEFERDTGFTVVEIIVPVVAAAKTFDGSETLLPKEKAKIKLEL